MCFDVYETEIDLRKVRLERFSITSPTTNPHRYCPCRPPICHRAGVWVRFRSAFPLIRSEVEPTGSTGHSRNALLDFDLGVSRKTVFPSPGRQA